MMRPLYLIFCMLLMIACSQRNALDLKAALTDENSNWKVDRCTIYCNGLYDEFEVVRNYRHQGAFTFYDHGKGHYIHKDTIDFDWHIRNNTITLDFQPNRSSSDHNPIIFYSIAAEKGICTYKTDYKREGMIKFELQTMKPADRNKTTKMDFVLYKAERR